MKRKQASKGPDGGKCKEDHKLRDRGDLSDMVRFILLGTRASIYKDNLKAGPTPQVTGKMHVIIQISKNHFTTFLPTLVSGDDAHLQYCPASAQCWTI